MKTADRNVRPTKTWVSQNGAARVLPISAATLREFARRDEFFGPDITCLCGVPEGLRRPLRLIRYHINHVGLIERVLTGELDRETAGMQLELWRRQRRNHDTEATESTEAGGKGTIHGICGRRRGMKTIWSKAMFPFQLAWLLIGGMWIIATTHLDDRAPWRDAVKTGR